MPNLIYYIPNHGYSIGDTVYESNLDANFFVRDPDNSPLTGDNSFLISTSNDDSNIVQFTETITDGFVREVDPDSGATTISGLNHLEGETVKVTSGGRIVGTETVTDGSITVSEDVFTYQVGLPYSMKVRTMRLAVPQETGTIQTRIKRINETVVRYIKSIGGKAGVEYDGVEYLTDINATFSSESADTDKDARLTTGGNNEDAYTVVRSNDPLPFTGIATIVSFEVEERR